MSGTFYGADVAALRQLAQRFTSAADDLDRAARVLTQQVMTTTQWRGADAEGFRGQWSGGHRVNVVAVAGSLRSAAGALTRNADEQERASAVGGAGTGGVGGGGVRSGRIGIGVLPPGWFGIDDIEGPHGGPWSPTIEGSVDPWGFRHDGSAYASSDLDGVAAGVAGSVALGAGAAAAVSATMGPASVAARAKVFGGARADGEASVNLGLEGASAHVGGGAFAGVEASADASVEVGGVTGKVDAGVWAGFGVRADADASISYDKVKLSIDVGASLWFGGHVSPSIEFSPRELVDDIQKLENSAWNPTHWFH